MLPPPPRTHHVCIAFGSVVHRQLLRGLRWLLLLPLLFLLLLLLLQRLCIHGACPIWRLRIRIPLLGSGSRLSRRPASSAICQCCQRLLLRWLKEAEACVWQERGCSLLGLLRLRACGACGGWQVVLWVLAKSGRQAVSGQLLQP